MIFLGVKETLALKATLSAGSSLGSLSPLHAPVSRLYLPEVEHAQFWGGDFSLFCDCIPPCYPVAFLLWGQLWPQCRSPLLYAFSFRLQVARTHRTDEVNLEVEAIQSGGGYNFSQATPRPT